MLVITNRLLDTQFSDERTLTRAYTPFAPTLNLVQVAGPDSSQPAWRVSSPVSEVDDKNAMDVLTAYFQGSKPVLVYVHGNNNTPADCFARCKALEDQYNLAVIGYSWTSEGYQPDGSDLAGIDNKKLASDGDEDSLSDVTRDKLGEGWIQRKARRYAQAKVNAQHSTASLARLFRLVAAARLATMTQPYSVALHSLGCHLLHYAINQDGAAESFAVAQNVALMAGCTGAAKHTAWVGQLNPVRRVYVIYTKADSVLAAATVIDCDVKLGTNPGDERLAGPKYRYIDFEGAAKMKVGAHRYFVADPGKKLSKEANRLFQRVFSSQEDFSADEMPRVVYPVGCSENGSVCYMGNSSTPNGGI